MVVEKPSDNLMANVLLGSEFNPTVNARITLSIAEMGTTTRVVADLAVVTNPGSGFEKLTVINRGKAATDIQNWLLDIKTSVMIANAKPSPKK